MARCCDPPCAAAERWGCLPHGVTISTFTGLPLASLNALRGPERPLLLCTAPVQMLPRHSVAAVPTSDTRGVCTDGCLTMAPHGISPDQGNVHCWSGCHMNVYPRIPRWRHSTPARCLCLSGTRPAHQSYMTCGSGFGSLGRAHGQGPSG